MKTIIKILLGIFLLSVIAITAVLIFSDIEIMQHPVVKTIPSDQIIN